MLSDDLQKALDAAFVAARMEGHDLLTVEHLLLALLSDTQISEALTAVGCDMERLEADLREYINTHLQRMGELERHEVQPTLSFQRVLQRGGIVRASAARPAPVGGLRADAVAHRAEVAGAQPHSAAQRRAVRVGVHPLDLGLPRRTTPAGGGG